MDIEKEIIRQMRSLGRDIFLRGLVGSHSGNMSVRVEDQIYITRTRSMLGRLKKEDMVKVPMEKIGKNVLKKASTETPVHIHIYKNTNAKAVLHAHPPYSVLLSVITKSEYLVPIDWEGRLILKTIPFIRVGEDEEQEKKGKKISDSLKNNNIVVVRGHGSFAIGDSLEEAYMYTMSLESSCFFLYHLEILMRGRE